MFHIFSVTIFIAAALLSGCASLTAVTTQNIKVSTGKEIGATCMLSNNKGNWTISDTPSSVDVKRLYSDLSVVCEKGCKSGGQTVKATTKGMVAGNVEFGGILGSGIDCASGASYAYP